MRTCGNLYPVPTSVPLVNHGTGSWTVRSESDRTLTYTVTRTPAGTWECDCPGFRYHEHCKHVDRQRAEWDAPFTMDDVA